MPKTRALVWIRRDLRLADHAALAHAASIADEVAVVFVFDVKILHPLPKNDRRVGFIHACLKEVDQELREKNSALIVLHGDPCEEIPKLAESLGAFCVCSNRDYEPAAKKRDAEVDKRLIKKGIQFLSFKDQVVFEGLEIKTGSGTAFKVFTPFKRAWLAALKARDYDEKNAGRVAYLPQAVAVKHSAPHSLKDLGFDPLDTWLEPGRAAALKRLKNFLPKMKDYEDSRNFPGEEGTSGISAHLRFGTISVRECVRAALAHKSKGAEVWVGELIWRDFYQMILDQYPHVAEGSFKPQYDKIKWPGKEAHYDAWEKGQTGYPLVDAAMRLFAETGWIHNRMRMVVASFLTKDLLIDYRRGEAYFAAQLLDFDMAANNGGWQWSASTGCDAQPYFRIFNPYSQSERFDPNGDFIRANLPELKNLKGKKIHRPDLALLPRGAYPKPIVEHDVQRDKAIALFKETKKNG